MATDKEMLAEMDVAVQATFDLWARVRHIAIGYHVLVTVREPLTGAIAAIPLCAGEFADALAVFAPAVETLAAEGKKDAREFAGGEGLPGQARKPRKED